MKEKLIAAFKKNLNSVTKSDQIWFSGGCNVAADIFIALQNYNKTYGITYESLTEEISSTEYGELFDLADKLRNSIIEESRIEREEKNKSDLEKYING